MPTPAELADIQARHLAELCELQSLGMGIARGAAAAAARQFETPAPQPASPSAPEPARGCPDAALAFSRAARIVHQSITLETRVAHGDLLRGRATLPPPLADRRRVLIRNALHRAVQDEPDRAQRRRQIDEHVDHELRADPAQELPSKDILETVAEGLQIPLDPAKLADELIGFFYQPPEWARPGYQPPPEDLDHPEPPSRFNL